MTLSPSLRIYRLLAATFAAGFGLGLMMAQAQALGLEPVLLGIARDDAQELAQFLHRGLAYDVLLVSGGDGDAKDGFEEVAANRAVLIQRDLQFTLADLNP